MTPFPTNEPFCALMFHHRPSTRDKISPPIAPPNATLNRFPLHIQLLPTHAPLPPADDWPTMRPDAYARLQASAAANYVAGEGAYTPYEYQASLAPSMVNDSTLENKYAVLLNKTCAKVLSTVPVRHTCRHVPRACSPCLLHISCTHARFIFLEPHPRSLKNTSTFLCTMTMVLTLVFPDRCCPPRTLPTS